MSSIKRYDIEYISKWSGSYMEMTLNEEGDWVRHADIALLLAAGKRLREAAATASGMTGHQHWDAEGTRGVNCPQCIRQREIMDGINSALAAYDAAAKGAGGGDIMGRQTMKKRAKKASAGERIADSIITDWSEWDGQPELRAKTKRRACLARRIDAAMRRRDKAWIDAIRRYVPESEASNVIDRVMNNRKVSKVSKSDISVPRSHK